MHTTDYFKTHVEYRRPPIKKQIVCDGDVCVLKRNNSEQVEEQQRQHQHQQQATSTHNAPVHINGKTRPDHTSLINTQESRDKSKEMAAVTLVNPMAGKSGRNSQKSNSVSLARAG